MTLGGGRFTLQDLHQHFLWLQSRQPSTSLSHLNKPNFESKTLSELLSLTQLHVHTRVMVNRTRGGHKGHKSSLKASALYTHMKKFTAVFMWLLSFVMEIQRSPVQSNAKLSGWGCNGAIKLSYPFSSLLSLKEMARLGISFRTFQKQSVGGSHVGSRCASLYPDAEQSTDDLGLDFRLTSDRSLVRG